MADLLFLTHRLPYPPDKGDKVRSYHLLEYLAARHRVFLGTFIDDPDDEVHLDTVRAMCAGLHVARLALGRARLRSAVSLLRGEAMTRGFYRDASLAHWVEQVRLRHKVSTALVFSSSMAQYTERLPGVSVLVDFVDVDSAKWMQYGERARWPLSWLYRLEGRRLLAYERLVAHRAQRSFFVTDNEVALFRRLAPECAASVEAVGNGVDSRYFSPDPARASPFPVGSRNLVFTGAMDYRPNVDAVCWFAQVVLPQLRHRWPGLRLHVVGRRPSTSVTALAGPAVAVTGGVPDVRPYLQHADVVVAPLRVARGVQNKVLEAMAMGRPVVAAAACAQAIGARAGLDLQVAGEAEEWVDAVDALLREPAHGEAIGSAGRRRVQADHAWPDQLSRLDAHLERATA